MGGGGAQTHLCPLLLKVKEPVLLLPFLLCSLERKEEIWLSPVTKASTPTEKSKKQRDNKKKKPLPKTSITQRLWTEIFIHLYRERRCWSRKDLGYRCKESGVRSGCSNVVETNVKSSKQPNPNVSSTTNDVRLTYLCRTCLRYNPVCSLPCRFLTRDCRMSPLCSEDIDWRNRLHMIQDRILKKKLLKSKKEHVFN